MRIFAQYAGVVSRTYPEKAVFMWVHMAHIMSGTDQPTTAWWRDYIWLRHGYSSIDKANFELDQCLYTRALVESTENGQKPVPYPPVRSSDLHRHKRRKIQECFAWNDRRGCASQPCRFVHCCSQCGGDTDMLFVCRPKAQQWGPTQGTKLNCFCQLPVLMCM